MNINSDSKEGSIVINDVAASYGGALSILKSFLIELQQSDRAKSYRWFVFVSNDLVDEYKSNHVDIVKIDAKKRLKRLCWDTFGIKKWLTAHNASPCLAVSLMGVGFVKLNNPQMVYVHSALPYCDFKGFKLFEIRAMLYQKTLAKWAKVTIRKNSTIIVQTNWMKEIVHRELGIEQNSIHVIPPKIESLNVYEKKSYFSIDYQLFYPATPSMSYKNHELLIRMLGIMKKEEPDQYSKLKLIFTCKPETNRLTKYYNKLAENLTVNDRIEWKGYLNKEEMLRYYIESTALVFPSRLESFGLPLREAASVGKPIIVLDKPYAREVLGNYKGVTFLSDNPYEWSKAVNQLLQSEIRVFEALNDREPDETRGIIEFILNTLES